MPAPTTQPDAPNPIIQGGINLLPPPLGQAAAGAANAVGNAPGFLTDKITEAAGSKFSEILGNVAELVVTAVLAGAGAILIVLGLGQLVRRSETGQAVMDTTATAVGAVATKKIA